MRWLVFRRSALLWAARLRERQGMGREVFVYFNNDGYGNAVRNAQKLREMVRA